MSGRLRILHLGLGAFHRAHQAVFMQRLIDAGDTSWQLVGGNLLAEDPDVARLLQAQGGAYTVETVTPDEVRSYDRIEAISAAMPFEAGWAALIRLGADPATRIVSFTVTEAGYEPDSIHGAIYAALTAILRQRQRSDAGPLTLLSCDNLRHNGDRVRAGLTTSLQRSDDGELLAWTLANTRCPNSMVDRITPRPPPELRARVLAATGFDDAAPVMAEHFLQWVIEDDFCGGRPSWERVGVQMVDSVAPFEEAKIRLLNASHSAIAWAGSLVGHHFIHEGARDEAVRLIASDYAGNDAIPCLQPSPIDLESYRDAVLDRFCNAALQDTNERVAMDGSVKLAGFVAPTVRERLARNESIASVVMLPALFMAYLKCWHEGRLPHVRRDQGMDDPAAHALCAGPDPMAALAADPSLWGQAAGDPRLLTALRDAARRVDRFLDSRG